MPLPLHNRTTGGIKVVAPLSQGFLLPLRQMDNTRSKNRTRTKIKERLDGKDAAILISEDDANNSFLQKSEGQYKRTENSRRIPETSHKYETTEDNTDMFHTESTNKFH